MVEVRDIHTVGDAYDTGALRDDLVEAARCDRGECLIDQVGARCRPQLESCAVEIRIGAAPPQSFESGIERTQRLVEARTRAGDGLSQGEPLFRESRPSELDRHELQRAIRLGLELGLRSDQMRAALGLRGLDLRVEALEREVVFLGQRTEPCLDRGNLP